MTRHTEEFDELVVVHQDPQSRRWFPVGRLSFDGELYHFQYTRGAVEAHAAGAFLPFGVMKDLEADYRSRKLFPLFQNRVMPRSRPEYADYTRWLLGAPGELTPLEELGRSGAARATDNIQLYPVPRPVDGYYRMSFFAHGVRHLPQAAQAVIGEQAAGTRLFLMRDIQNARDPDGLALRTESPIALVGYCPRFLCTDFMKIVREDQEAIVVLAQVNSDAPLQFRFRCELSAHWPEGFRPFDTEAFQMVTAAVAAT
ncbi:MAG: HIRAN domain-containing protein [Candidatus Hydrogenedentes bacterium]|nr:HIRAN domain-containing protein [Candidatus Hydrogenedentota bacterium]